ncbi:MAG: hypothetical protein ACJAZ3_000649 [Sphingobacteriales bacterium]
MTNVALQGITILGTFQSMLINHLNDPLGQAVLEYLETTVSQDIIVKSDLADDDVIPSEYLFRSLKEMPEMEQVALKHVKGKTLDVGAGAGAHSILLKDKVDLKSIDVSPGCVEVLQKRGITNVEQADFFELKNQKYDTILMLMNGIGIVGDLKGLDNFFKHVKTILEPEGQILLDSSDIQYIYLQDDGSMLVDLNSEYHGITTYNLEYKGVIGKPFSWLFVDLDTLEKAGRKNGYKTEVIHTGNHHDFLVKITLDFHI